jgi:HSP20 family protein
MMNLIPWRNKTERGGNGGEMTLPRLRHQIDDLFDEFLRDPFSAGANLMHGMGFGGGGLKTDLAESDDEVTVRAEMPGVDPKDVEISVSGHVLTISGEKKQETEEKQRNYHYVERQFGSFHRTVQLPSSVDPDKVDAKFKNGVLTVSVSKRPEAKARRIQVREA